MKLRLFVIIMFVFAVIGMLILTACSSSSKAAPSLADSSGTNFKGVADGPTTRPPSFSVKTIRKTFTVMAVDLPKRIVTLQDDTGTITKFKCGKAIGNLDQIKVGDRVNAKVVEETAIFVSNADAPVSAGIGGWVTLSPAGEGGGDEMVETAQVVDMVDAVNIPNRTIAMHGIEGIERVFHAGPDVNLLAIHVNDNIVIQYAQGLAVLIEAAPATTTKPSTQP